MKIKRILIIVYVLIASFAYSQKDINNQGEKTKIRGINEISYQIPLAIGYNHIQNFNDKLLIGAGLQLGLNFYLIGYVDLFQFKIFTRNLFTRNKFNRKFDYDIGLFFSYPYFEFEMDAFYGIVSSAYYNIWKIKAGMSMLTGVIKDGNVKNFPKLMFTPTLIYKF